MTSTGQVADNMNGISRLTSMPQAAFSNAWAPDYRDRYMMEMQSSPYHGRPSSFHRNGSTTTSGYHHHPSMESVPLVWRQRQALESDDALIVPNHRIHLAHNNNISNGSKRGVEGSSSRIPSAILGRSDFMNRDSHSSIQSSSSELYDSNSGSVMTGDWQRFVGSDNPRYTSLLPPMTASTSGLQQPPSTVGGGANEGAMIRELIGKLGGSSTMGSSSSSLLSSGPSPSPSQQCAGVLESGESLAAQKPGAAGNHCWNSGANPMAAEIPTNVGRGLTVDPSKGGLSLNHGTLVTAGITTSNCLAPFSADPGFAERAAKFSSFSNGNYARSFPSDSDGPARTRLRSGASPRSPGTSSSAPLLQETAGRVICNDSTASEGLPESRVREIQSGSGGVDDRVASAAASDKDDENSLEQNHVRAEGYITSKTLSRTAGRLLRSARNGEEEGDGSQGAAGATSTDASSDIKRVIPTPEQGDTEESPVEACSSPGARSGATDISVKKRKPSFEERPSNKHVASGSASSHHTKDAKTAEIEDAKVKRLRRGDGLKDKDDLRAKGDRSCSETSGESSPRTTKDHSKLSTEHPKSDYIHVRARRGQATDSHSLAERVRREKISERMKFLQDLVPGCSKVTGKAVMLDEIINYVQSLQRQVEFLSMKLAFVNPRLDFHHESYHGKEGPHSGSQAMVLGSETSIAYPPLQPQQHQTQVQPGLEYQLHPETTARRSMSAMPVVSPPMPRVDNFEDGVRQTVWDDGELHSIVKMGFGNSQALSTQASQCNLPPGQVKVELQQSAIACL